MAMRPVLLAAMVASGLSMVPAVAQTVPAPVNDSSLTHSALKATTFKIGTITANLGVLSLAAGGVIGGIGLTAFNTASSWVVYTTNDYLWDTYAPPPVKRTVDQSFDTGGEFWRTTGKFLTYKPVVFGVKVASIYVVTGSAATALVFGPASSLTNTVVFYLNNVAWDSYDWYAAAPQQAAAVKP